MEKNGGFKGLRFFEDCDGADFIFLSHFFYGKSFIIHSESQKSTSDERYSKQKKKYF